VAALGDTFGGPGPESTLDFQASIPLIWPQKTVLYETDDEVYELEGTAGWMNSRPGS
jgi:tripeptidyl-peptidase-1